MRSASSSLCAAGFGAAGFGAAGTGADLTAAAEGAITGTGRGAVGTDGGGARGRWEELPTEGSSSQDGVDALMPAGRGAGAGAIYTDTIRHL